MFSTYFVITWLLVIFLTGIPCQAGNIDGLRVLFRYDDYSHLSNSNLEEKLFDTIGSSGGALIVGVIPFHGKSYPEGENPFLHTESKLGEEKVTLLKKNVREGVVDISLHGYSHRKNFQYSNGSSEFAGLPASRQQRLLRVGKAVLEKSLRMPVDIFVPPFNAYDMNTISALETVGFKLLSAGEGGCVPQNSKMLFLPGTTYPQKLRTALTDALTSGIIGGLVVVTIHSYDFVESGYELPNFRQASKQVTLEALRRDIEWIQERPGLSIVSFHELLETGEDLSGDRLVANNRLKNSFITHHVLLPNHWRFYPLKHVYYSQEMADRVYCRQLWAASIMYGALFILSVAAPWYFLRKQPQRFITLVRPVRIVLVILIALIILWAYTYGFYMKAAMAVTLCVGLLLGTRKWPAQPFR